MKKIDITPLKAIITRRGCLIENPGDAIKVIKKYFTIKVRTIMGYD
jgi:hypothetical protein